MQRDCVSVHLACQVQISVGFIISKQTKTILDLNQMPLGLMIHPSIRFIPLLHPFMAAMGPSCHGYYVLAGVAKP